MSTVKGKFIVLEGIDGVGKTSIQDRIVSILEAQGKKVLNINNIGEIGDSTTILSRAIREKISTRQVSNTLELVYLYLASLVSVSKGMEGSRLSVDALLEEYDYVICSRWIYSTMVYGISSATNTEEDNIVVELIESTYRYSSLSKPDLVIVVDADIEEVIERLAVRDNIVDYFSASEKLRVYHERFRDIDTYASKLFPYISFTIDWNSNIMYVKNDDLDIAVIDAMNLINKIGD